jgi:hypothetical protein
MKNPITGIDHAIVGVRDLEAARLTFGHLGFTLCPRGRHIGWGTANYCAMFQSGYLELLGIVDPAQFTNNLDRFLEGGEGLLGFAFATADAEAACDELAARGIVSEGPKALSRKIEMPDGDVEPKFANLYTDAQATAGLRTFLCQHLTPEMVWRPEWLTHPNGARGIVSLTASVADPGQAALAFGALLGPDAVSAGRGAVEVQTGAGILRLCAPEQLRQLFPGIANLTERPAPALAGLRVAVADAAATADFLGKTGVPFVRDSDRLLRLDPRQTHGFVLEFETA